MNKNLVSVIIPTYNRTKHLENAMDSVWKQTYRPIEVVIVDDGSTDNTKQIINDWVIQHTDKDFKVVYIYQINSGAPSARNNGIKNASGRYLQFLDSDDYLMPEKLELQINKMQEENTGFCICDYYHTDEYGKIILLASNNRSIKQILTEARFLHTSIGVIDTSYFKPGLIKWNPKIKKGQDLDFNLKMFFIVDEFSYVNKALFKWIRHSEKGISNTTKFTINEYLNNLISLLKFHIKYCKSIQAYKKNYIKYLYKKGLWAIYCKTQLFKILKKNT
ncbi:glycosyltransferase family 2 protein [Aequorivita sp. 609]|uniref:glycosyltransferase family 2 protein n=1 Tax=Aequorivita TaxID=153265 RepID=UPI0016215F38|nr:MULTISPECIES: glycosyltransferase family 2 protein [Aequorivita]MBB6681542.1 glycosyltransferase family 2 protein [Aequorivita sp. 609]